MGNSKAETVTLIPHLEESGSEFGDKTGVFLDTLLHIDCVTVGKNDS